MTWPVSFEIDVFHVTFTAFNARNPIYLGIESYDITDITQLLAYSLASYLKKIIIAIQLVETCLRPRKIRLRVLFDAKCVIAGTYLVTRLLYWTALTITVHISKYNYDNVLVCLSVNWKLFKLGLTSIQQ